ncbi:tyrosine-type recombinase/integrase [Rubrolithibacter danxiaensis]|uniref:tyrosine-type recombinase/integrase n=1 Tax=Rubrolithibacter danxiaensis TaxID=3390805 RepID=UPI003BF80721
MYTEPKIISTENLKTRSYILFYYNGERFREYNGKKLGMSITPNRAASLKERDRLLKKLLFEFHKALEKGWNPTQESELRKSPKSTIEVLGEIINERQKSSLSATYKRDLCSVYKQLLEFLLPEEKNGLISSITVARLTDFLTQFDTSGTHYMNKRRALSALLTTAVNKGYLTSNPIEKTAKKKSKATLHKIYTPEQTKKILSFLKESYPNLHLCCLLTYGCLLRPHEESRLLKRGHFNDQVTQIQLSGFENKSGRIRTVYISDYVREELIERGIHLLEPNQNIISRTDKPFNVSYFSLQWSRAKKKMLKQKGLLEPEQTIYSFRHSAAINIYKRTKDLHILQQLLGHSNMIVTLKYLRGLGQVNLEHLKESYPEL